MPCIEVQYRVELKVIRREQAIERGTPGPQTSWFEFRAARLVLDYQAENFITNLIPICGRNSFENYTLDCLAPSFSRASSRLL